MFRILITDRFATSALERLRVNADIEVGQITPSEVYEFDISSFDALLIRSRTQIDDKLLRRAHQLKVIVTMTSGFDHIDLKRCEEKKIKVFYTPEANAQSAAELTWTLILNCFKKISAAQAVMKTGIWERGPFVGQEIYKKTLGIIGLGRVGRRVAQIARAFEMPILAYDPYVEDEVFRNAGAQRSSWEEVFKSCDILTLHVPLTEQTREFINPATLKQLAQGVVLINTSRGAVIKESAVLEFLQKGHIAALGLDVFEKEPLPLTSPFLSHPNVVLTPHIGGNTIEAFERASHTAVDKILAFLQGEKVLDQLTRDSVCQQ